MRISFTRLFAPLMSVLAPGNFQLSGQVFDQMRVGFAVRQCRSNTSFKSVNRDTGKAISIAIGLYYTSKRQVAIVPLVAH